MKTSIGTLALTCSLLLLSCGQSDQKQSEARFRSKLEALADLKDKYQIEAQESKEISSSIVHRASKGVEVEPGTFDDFKSQVQALQVAQVKGSRDLGGRMFARASIQEITFDTEANAAAFVELAGKFKTEHAWVTIDKAPSSIFQTGRQVYYISAGGHYMQGIYREIAEKMKAVP